MSVEKFQSTTKMHFTDKVDGAIIEIDLSKKRRCPYCGMTIFKGVEGKGTKIECKCTRCKQIFRVEVI